MSSSQQPEFIAFGRPDFGDAEIEAVTRVMRSGWVGMGKETIAFEEELAACVGAPYAVTVNSCTSALFLSLVALGVGEGDEVICPSLTWCSTANAAIYLGARPVFCDVDTETLCATPETVLARVTPRTKAVIVVHMGGLAADVDGLRAALPSHVSIVEDAAHALGARYADGSPVGASGNLTCFSFYANKNLSTGEGGAVATFDPAVAARLRSLRQHGLSGDAWKRHTHAQNALALRIDELGYKMNYTDLQAAIGRVQLRRQPEFAARRLALAQAYRRCLSGSSLPLAFQRDAFEPCHARHLLVVTLPTERMAVTRDGVLMALRERNVGASLHYRPLHLMPVYRTGRAAALANTEYLADRVLTLPIGASMTIADVESAAAQLLDVLATCGEPRVAA
jgi:dTDP-4-amino-4,6-dideoxygalactose transaminase